MAKHVPDLEQPMLLISIGYKSFILPWEQGLVAFNALKDVQFVERGYGEARWKKETDNVTVTCEIFSVLDQGRLLLGGGDGATN